MNGIPTTFKGRLYRSTLEAKWASFFDLAGWEFEYEPFETGDWIPDFLIRGAGPGVLVEVKPVVTKEQALGHTGKMVTGARSVDWQGDLLILGVSPSLCCDGLYPSLGWVGERLEGEYDQAAWDFGPAPLGIWKGGEGECNERMAPGFCHESQGFHDRITGLYDGGCYGGSTPTGFTAWVKHAWNRAASRVQWSPSATPDESIKAMIKELARRTPS